MRNVDGTTIRAITRMTIVFACVLGSAPALARCYIDSSTSNTVDTLTFSDATYVRDTVIGTKTTLYTRTGLSSYLHCDISKGAVKTTATVIDGELVPGYTNVYKTGVDGIGIKFYAIAFGYSNTQPAPFEMSVSSSNTKPSFFSAAQLIVTGPVLGGTIETLPSMQVIYKQGSDEALTYTLSVNSNISIVAKACKLIGSEIEVKLPQVLSSTMKAPGSVGGETGFNIRLTDCPAGLSVYATLTDATDPTNVSTTLKPADESTAGGVGYQVLYRGSPIAYGPDSSAPATKNQFLVGRPTGPSLDIPMSVRYVRTADALSPGTVKGHVILNMSYQ